MSADKALRIYLLAVCFVAMVCAAITAGMVCYGLVKIAAPELTLDAWSYGAHQSLETFRRSQFSPTHGPQARVFASGSRRAIALHPPGYMADQSEKPEQAPLSNDELERERQQSYQQVLNNHRRGAMQDLIRLSIVLLVASVLFYTHWRMARRYSPTRQ